MLDKVVEVPREVAALHRAENFLRRGIPLNLTTASAARYAQECRELIDLLGPGDSLLAVKLSTAQIIAPAALRSAQCDLDAAAEAAADLAERTARLGGQVAHAYALATWGMTHPAPEYTARRAQVADETLTIAAEHGESALVPVGYALLLVALLEQGEIRSLDLELLEQHSRAASLTNTPEANPAVWFGCLRLILDGDSDEAERLAHDLLRQSPTEGTLARALHTTQLGMIRWMQGRIADAEGMFLAARRDYPDQFLWPASLAWLWLLQGRRASAETLLRSLPPPEEIPRDRYWLSTLAILAEVARMRASLEDAERLHALLRPFAAHLVPAGVGVSFWGTAARTVGLLDEQLGLLQDARAHLELAIEMSARVGALAWHAQAQIELAEFGMRHEVVDISAFELLAEARATSEARGFTALARRARHRPQIRVLGGFEVISLCGARAEWASHKARVLLKMLVAAHGVTTSREVFMEVLWPGEEPAALGNRFSVAINVIRRALDPERQLPTQHHVVTEGDSVRLALDHLDIDLERFLALAQRQDDASARAAKILYRGPAFSEEPYAEWAQAIRDHAEHLRHLLD